MSSGDELGGFAPTTPGPAPVQKRPVPRPVPRVVAGPSSKPQKPAPVKKTTRKESETIILDKSPDVTMISSDEDDPPTRKAAATNKGKSRVAQTTNGHTNGGTTTKPKGKTKPGKPPQPPVDTTEAADVEMVDSDPIPAVRPSKSRSNSKASPSIDAATIAKRERREIDALKRENERLRRRLEDAGTHHAKLSEQLESLMKIRETEPEKLLEERISQYEATTRAQDLLIQEQSAELARLKVLAESDRLHAVPFLSREQADAEMRGLENKVRALSESVKSKDVRLSELQTEYRELQVQLEHEIKMAKAQKPSVHDTATRGKPDPKQGLVIELYERLTNFIILNVQRSTFEYFGLPVTTYKCLYTHIDDPLGEPSGEDPSLSFELQDTWARKDGQEIVDIRSKDELERKTMYIPRDLDKQTKEFLIKLDFFREQFLFTPTQMNVFLRTLGDRLSKNAPPGPNSQESKANQSVEGQGNQKSQEQRDEEIVEVLMVDKGRK